MEPNPGLFVCLLLLGSTELCCPQPLGLLQGGARPPVPSLPPVQVQCLEAQLVVTVSRDLFGTGKLVQPSDLTLGPEGCRPLVSTGGDDAVVKFEVGVHECGSSVQVTNDALVYSTFLLHKPRPVGNLSIVRTNRAEVPIECHYPRQGNVSSRAILPTWVPFRTTVSSEEKLVFSLRLMEENWSTEKTSPTFFLGEAAHLQAEVRTGSHLPLRLFVDYCVATPTLDQDASPRHTIVDFHGCLVDGLSDSSSAFQGPRPRPDILRFTVDVFHFANDSRNTVYITCHLKVTPANQAPDQLNKACSYSKSSSSWTPVEGAADICKCCDKGNCGGPGYSRRQAPARSQEIRSMSRKRRHVTEEADVTVGPLIFLGEAGGHSVEGWTSPVHPSMALGLGLAVMAFLSLAVVLGLTKRCHSASHSMSLSQ
ncbi:PREDICTED: zona pellucida sperm-binding protein 3 [Chinchilla lanigera]|uniref:zona pellucida sperm-binding protein 3 n=1 Tax=Chinchilla lanigera TaxID=34839 RepID=UPI00038EC43B|nr:PREDICTED: zona pellucida sperm-binding protein 3 [Chinchilla lanigera]